MNPIFLCNVPCRATPTNFPPIALTFLTKILRQAGYTAEFFDLDVLRMSHEEVVAHFVKAAPAIIGISAVVSTSYAYVKSLSLRLKQALPSTPIILGGAMASSAHVILKKCGIDLCVIGEGERPLLELVRLFERQGNLQTDEALSQIKGLTYLDKEGRFCFTGFPPQSLADELPQPDYELLEKHSKIGNYIQEWQDISYFKRDPRSAALAQTHPMSAWVVVYKGCVSRCTFCHRWNKGLQSYPIKGIVDEIKFLKERYKVGFFIFDGESLGADPRHFDLFLESIKPLNILWIASAMRVKTVNPGLLKRMRDVGCTGVNYGIESCSDRMLRVMEKGATAQENIEALIQTHQAGLATTPQFVMGMPGEDDETIRETTENLKRWIVELSPEEVLQQSISSNYVLSLPGTPVYEYALLTGKIQDTLDGEEEYLLKVSNMEAVNQDHYLNFSDWPEEVVKIWPLWIFYDLWIHYFKTRGWSHAKSLHIQGMSCSAWRLRLFSLLGRQYLRYFYFRLRMPKRGFLGALWDAIATYKPGRVFSNEHHVKYDQSLRKVVEELNKKREKPEDETLALLRRSR